MPRVVRRQYKPHSPAMARGNNRFGATMLNEKKAPLYDTDLACITQAPH